MIKFDHLTVPVSNWKASRDYVGTLGLAVGFEIPDRATVALQDEQGFTIFRVHGTVPAEPGQFAPYFQVEDVRRSFETLSSRGTSSIPLGRCSGDSASSFATSTATPSDSGTSAR
jgi:hypothetical protein